ncbi:MAG: hypothetical protein ACYC28_01180 [Longimicrobiales bacterium]
MRFFQRSALALLLLVAACSGDDVSGPNAPVPVPELTLSTAAAQPGAVVILSGVPASAAPATHWVEVAGQRSPLLLVEGGAAFLVPAFLDEGSTWPAPPAGPQDVELVSESGVAARAEAALTVQPLQAADGTTAAVVNALELVGPAISSIGAVMPSQAVESRGVLLAMGDALDSLTATPDAALGSMLAGLQAEPDQLRLLDAMLFSNGSAQRITRFATTLSTVANGIHGGESGLPAGAARQESIAGAGIAISDELLSQLMQLSVYLEQNTDLQSEFASDLSNVLGIVSVLGVDLGRFTPVGKMLEVIAVHSTLQAMFVRTFVLSALPSRLDSLTLGLAQSTIAPDAMTAAVVNVHASNRPEPISIGDFMTVFQNVAGLVAKGEYIDTFLLYMIGKLNDALKLAAEVNDAFEYDPDVTDAWSMPDVAFGATVVERDLIDLRSGDEGVVVPHPSEVNWMATAIDSATTTIWVQPSIGQATIPILMEWLADHISMNSGSASDLVLGAFGSDIKASEHVPVWVAPPEETDLTGSWTLVVSQVCVGTMSVTQNGNDLSVSGGIGGTFCPFAASGSGTGQLNGSDITFGIALGSANGESGQVEFTGTVAADGNSMSGTYQGDSGGEWYATRN